MFDIKDSIDQVIELMKDKADLKNIKIETKFIGFQGHMINLDGGLVQKLLTKTDEKRMQQVVLNLLSNALKYTQSDGLIQILVKNMAMHENNSD